MTFKVGNILKMNPTSRSHVKTPYYVEVVYYDENAIKGQTKMITSIPGHHRCDMIVGNNWEYHLQRMSIMGDKSIFGKLIENQRLGKFFVGDVVNVKSSPAFVGDLSTTLPHDRYNIGIIVETIDKDSHIERQRCKVKMLKMKTVMGKDVVSWHSSNDILLNVEYYRDKKIEDILS